MILTLVREPNDEATPGWLQVDGKFFCYTIEDPDRKIETEGCKAKVYGKTCVPRGTYKVILSMSNRFGMVTPEILEVPCFKYIRIHIGNSADDSEGCILPGMHRQGNTVTSSRVAFDKLMEVLTPVHKYGIPIQLEIL